MLFEIMKPGDETPEAWAATLETALGLCGAFEDLDGVHRSVRFGGEIVADRRGMIRPPDYRAEAAALEAKGEAA